ncbi:MAG: DUF4920 domain-containing protein [Bacteroidota bacterium]
MKNYLFILLTLSMAMIACQEADSQSKVEEATAVVEEAAAEVEKMVYPADSIAPDGSHSFHGLRIAADEAMPVSQVVEMLGESGEVNPVKLMGTVEAACQAKGCWMTLKLDDAQSMRVKFKDYGFFVPKDAAGKTAIFEGRAFSDTTSVEELRHYAIDGGMEEAQAIKNITEPEIAINFEATGVIIQEGK